MIGQVSDETIAALDDVLEDEEQILGGLTSPGGALVLTDRHLVIVREGGRSRRPRTGVQTWPLDGSFRIQAWILRDGTGALIIDRERGATSFFVRKRDWPDAQRLIDEARRLSARADQ